MDFIIPIICVVAIFVVCALIFMKKNANQPKETSKAKETLTILTPAEEYHADDFIIMVEQLPAEAVDNPSLLAEITDSKMLAHINNLVPEFAQVGNTVNTAVQASGQVLYQAIIPAGAKLSNSQDMAGAVRGFYHGADGISGYANLVAVNQTGAIAANVASSAIGVASMVVGQYYMSQINEELSELSDSVSKIADFQDDEYKSKVFGLTVQIKKIASFQAEILENHELRGAEIIQLNSLEQNCIELLGQANLAIADIAKKNDLNYAQYEKELTNAQKWYISQQVLLETLCKITELKHALHLGTVSREQCAALIPTYAKQVDDAQGMLTAWHDRTTKRLGIEAASSRRKRDGVDGVFHWLPGLFNNDYNFRAISPKTASMIEKQTAGYAVKRANSQDLFQEDVRLIAKDGKIFYLPNLPQ